MFNVTVIRLKDLMKYLATMIVIIVIILLAKRYFFEIDLKNINIGQKISAGINKNVQNAINLELPEVKQVYEQSDVKTADSEELIDENLDNADEEFASQFFYTMIGLELGAINAEEETSIENNVDENKLTSESTEQENKNTLSEESEDNETKEDESSTEEKLELAKIDVKTEVVTENPIAESYTTKYNGVKIKNETDFELTDDILNTDSLEIDKSNVIIFHTHTCESYTSSEKYSYTPTGNFRTTDLNYSVARVGDELTSYLTEYGMNVVHDKTYHDYPSYSGSYTRSLSTVSNILKTTNSDIIIDLHRDAIGSYSSYAPTVKIGDDYCAQIMFVIGTNGGGLNHPNWKSNLQFAIKLQEIANEMYPGLFKPIILRNSRYNQHLGKAACIIEVGSTGNTLEQCLNSMKYFAEVMNRF